MADKPYKAPKAKIGDGVRQMTPKEQKAYNKHCAEDKALKKQYGKTKNQLVKEDIAKIKGGRKTGRRLFGMDDGTGGSEDGMYEKGKDLKKMQKRNQSGGKGDTPRNCFSEEFRDNYDKIFGKRKIKKKSAGRTVRKYK